MARGVSLRFVSRILKVHVNQSYQVVNIGTSCFTKSLCMGSSPVWHTKVTGSLQRQYSTLAWTPGNATNVYAVTLSTSGKTCHIKWEDGFQAEFHGIWLRHNCHCEHCRHNNGQRLLDVASIPADLYIDGVSTKGNNLLISWGGPDGSHRGHIPLNYLREHNYSPVTMMARRKAVKCEKSVKEIPAITFDDIRKSKNGLLRWLQQINEDGISIVKDVPTQDGQVAKVAEMIGPVTDTIYGKTFDVVMTPEPVNVAYSNVHLDLHMDLVYFESPPGLQLLHCLKFDSCVEGGDSVFLDIFTVADDFRISHPDLFEILTRVPATFQKVHYNRDYPVHIVNQKPHIKLNHLGEIVAVYWAPPFEGPLSVVGKDVEDYYRAYEMFAKSIRDSPHQLKHRLQPGELVVFNNLRMLHGRGSFQPNGGTRHLQGCYLNIDIFKSLTQVLNNLVGDCRLAKRVGNQCWF